MIFRQLRKLDLFVWLIALLQCRVLKPKANLFPRQAKFVVVREYFRSSNQLLITSKEVCFWECAEDWIQSLSAYKECCLSSSCPRAHKVMHKGPPMRTFFALFLSASHQVIATVCISFSISPSPLVLLFFLSLPSWLESSIFCWKDRFEYGMSA